MLHLRSSTMESNVKEKDRCRHHGRQTAGFFVNFFINILIVCVGTFYLIQLSQELKSLKEENQELKREVSKLKQIYSKDNPSLDGYDSDLVTREVLSLSAFPLVKQFEQKVSALKLDVNHIDAKIRKYHPQEADISCPSAYRLNPYTGTCFRHFQTARSWFDAKAYCEAAGDYLATFDTLDSAAWFRHQQLTAGWSGSSFIGGRRVADIWSWYGMHTGPVTIGYWARAEPTSSNDHCMSTFASRDYYWDDIGCSSKINYVCERKAF